MNNLNEFKIENFCDENNELFKKYYNDLNNPAKVLFLKQMKMICETNEMKSRLFEKIIDNHELIKEKIKMTDIVIKYYKKNDLIDKSEIGEFFKFYESKKKNKDLNNFNDILNLFYELINYEKVIYVLRECFYIFSNYRSCVYFLTPSIDFNKTDKKTIDEIIDTFKDNQCVMSQIISKVYIGDENPWGSKYYSTAYAMFKTLNIINKYYKNNTDVLKKMNIIFEYKKKSCNILKNLNTNYNKKKLINKKAKFFDSVDKFILELKDLGYNLWFSVELVFNTIYKENIFKNIEDSKVIDDFKIECQKTNNKLGIMCFLLITNNYISNEKILNKFNI